MSLAYIRKAYGVPAYRGHRIRYVDTYGGEWNGSSVDNLEFHQIADIFPLIQGKEFQELRDDISENGVHEPIVLHEEKILDGRNRFRACQEIGVSPEFVQYEGEDPVGYIVSLNLLRRHLNESQRAMVAARLANMEVGNPDFSNSANLQNSKTRAESADLLNVSERSVNTAKTVQKNGTESLVDAVTQGEISVSAAATAATLPDEEQEEIVEEIKEGAKPAEAIKAHVAHNSGNNEWYTPAEYVEAARAAMGNIDLDPASSELANQTVKATSFYTAENSGLEWPWRGRVWMNPPYGKKFIGKFIGKLCSSLDEKRIDEACVMVNNATDTEWFQSMASRMSACCFIKGRVKFNDHNGEPKNTPLQGQAIIYFGDKTREFKKHFKGFGFVVLPK